MPAKKAKNTKTVTTTSLKPRASRPLPTAVIEQDTLGFFIPVSRGIDKKKTYTDHVRAFVRPYADHQTKFRAGDTVTIRMCSAQSHGYIINEEELWDHGSRTHFWGRAEKGNSWEPTPTGALTKYVGCDTLRPAPRLYKPPSADYASCLAEFLKPEHRNSASRSYNRIRPLQGPKFHPVIYLRGLLGEGGLNNDVRESKKDPGDQRFPLKRDAHGLYIMVSGGSTTSKPIKMSEFTIPAQTRHHRLYVRPFTDRPSYILDTDRVTIFGLKGTSYYVVNGEELWHGCTINKTTGVLQAPRAFGKVWENRKDIEAASKARLTSVEVLTDKHPVLFSKAEQARMKEAYERDPVHIKYEVDELLEKNDLIRAAWDKPQREDPRGHVARFERMRVRDTEGDGILPADLPGLRDALKAKKKLEVPIRLGTADYHVCGYCEAAVIWECDGTKVQATTECPHQNGLEYSFELNVPSGTMIVANDLRPEFDITGDYNINQASQSVRCSLAFAEIGCAHAFVGNTSPAVFRQLPVAGQSGDVLLIGNPAHDEDYNDIEDSIPGERVAGISTGLWWYSIVDKTEYLLRGLKLDDSVDQVAVRPGVYRFTHYYFRKDFVRDAAGRPNIFSRVEWVREPDPVRDYAAERAGLNFTAGQVIANSIRKYPTLYAGHYAARRVADHIMCTIGGGGHWHENGFVQYDPEMKASDPEVAIPDFSDPTYRSVPQIGLMKDVYEESWYPMSDGDYSSLVMAGRGKIFLNPSFVDLARNVARAIMTVPKPTKVDSSMEMKHTISRWETNIKLATKALEGLDSLYNSAGKPFEKSHKKKA